METLKGKKIQIQVADGYAIYQVIREGVKTCRVRWVEDEENNPDGWVAIIGKEGTLNKDIVRSILI